MLVKQPSQVYKGDVGDNCWSPGEGEGLGSSAPVGVAWLAEWTAGEGEVVRWVSGGCGGMGGGQSGDSCCSFSQ